MKIGDRVKWSSHGGGGPREKVGYILAIVPAWEFPPFENFLGSHSYTPGGGRPRHHESYLVSVDTPGRRKPRLHWPWVSGLRRVRP